MAQDNLLAMIERFLDPKNDFAFKKIFGTEKNKDILIHFLNDVVVFADHAKVEDVKFLPTIQDPDISSKKESSVDVICTDQFGKKHIVEMQVAKFKGFEKRAQYYAAKAYSGQLDEGEAYYKLNEVIFLAIVGFVMFPDKLSYKSDHIILDKETKEQNLKDFSFTFLELPKFKKERHELVTMTEHWCYFFKHAPTTKPADIDKILKDIPILEKAYTALEAANWTEAELNTYEAAKKQRMDAEAIHEQILDEGLMIGRQEGRQEQAIAMANVMLNAQEPLEKIIQYTGLNEQFIKALMGRA